MPHSINDRSLHVIRDCTSSLFSFAQLTVLFTITRREQVLRRPGAPPEEQQVPAGERPGPGRQRVGVPQQFAEQCVQHARAASCAAGESRPRLHTHDDAPSSRLRAHDAAPHARDTVAALIVPGPADLAHAASSSTSAGRANAAGRDDTPERVLVRPHRACANPEGN